MVWGAAGAAAKGGFGGADGVPEGCRKGADIPAEQGAAAQDLSPDVMRFGRVASPWQVWWEPIAESAVVSRIEAIRSTAAAHRCTIPLS